MTARDWVAVMLLPKNVFLQLDPYYTVPYLPVYNAHFFSLKSTFKFTMRIIHGFHCLVKKTKEDKNFAVIGV